MPIHQAHINRIQKKIKKNQPLVFIHTPRTGGTSVKKLMKKLNIKSLGHKQSPKRNDIGITFTIIRDPVQRYESWINHNLEKPIEKANTLISKYRNTALEINEIVKKISDHDILINNGVYKTLAFWTNNVDICITIDQLKDFLNMFGYCVKDDDLRNLNSSKKCRGKFNGETINRISKLFIRDELIYSLWTSLKSFEDKYKNYHCHLDKLDPSGKDEDILKVKDIQSIYKKIKHSLKIWRFNINFTEKMKQRLKERRKKKVTELVNKPLDDDTVCTLDSTSCSSSDTSSCSSLSTSDDSSSDESCDE